MELTEILPIQKTPHVPEIDRESLLARFLKIRRTTDWLTEPLTVEDQTVQSAMECSPVKWQLGHTTWFFETFVLAAHAKSFEWYHPKYSYLFNSYYNTIGERVARDLRGSMSRPTVSEITDYRRHIEHAIEEFVWSADDRAWHEAAPILELGLHHEQQHQELIVTDVKTVLAMNPLEPIYRQRAIAPGIATPLSWTRFDEALVEIGHPARGFSFDNESPRHRVFLESFALASRLTTNEEYLEFMREGGYSRHELWLSDGFALAQSEGWNAPKYWHERDGEWWNMTLQGMRRVEPHEPVTHVSQYEADAFAAWSGARLATEFEWEYAAQGLTIGGNLLESENFHPIGAESGGGLQQMFGDAWEWTRSAYLPYPGYHAQSGALGEYNGKFMSNQMVLRGGSCLTPLEHIRSTYRNFFPPDARWQSSGIRLAKDV